jgi:DNA-binding HxlR family transcriptional regulator
MVSAKPLSEKKEKPDQVPCPFQEAMDLISGKWTMSIINVLMSGTMRFKVLERNVTGINTRMLVKELKQLESGNIVKREAFATVPPTVEYSLTEKGLSLKPVLIAIQSWAIKNLG